MMKRQSIKAWAAGAALALAPAAWAEIPSASDQCTNDNPQSTPSSEFTVVGDGSVVRHEETGLEWQRCAVGQSWDGATCQGSAKELSWYDAKETADQQTNWRLPTKDELHSIVEKCRTNPSINQQVFPNTIANDFWSASPYAGDSDAAWNVDFLAGSDARYLKGNYNRVRLVRDAQ